MSNLLEIGNMRRVSGFMHRFEAWMRCTGMGMTREKRETVYH